MPGLITPYLPEPPVTKSEKKIARKVAVCILTLGALFIAAPTASASFVNLNPNNHVPNPGWEVD